MNLTQFFYIGLSVLLVSSGQIMFKYVAILINIGNPVFSIRVVLMGIGSFFISGLGSLIWIYLLRTVSLNKVYPFMALSFVVVPILSYLFFKDIINTSYFIGTAFIVTGILFIVKSTTLI